MYKQFFIPLKENSLNLFVGLSGYGIFAISVADYVQNIFFKPSDDQYKILFSLVGLTATFSALSFNAANSCHNDEHKRKFLHCKGKSLFRSAIFFSEAILVRYFFDVIRSPVFMQALGIIKWPYGLICLRTILTFVALFGIVLIITAFAEAHADLSLLRSELKPK